MTFEERRPFLNAGLQQRLENRLGSREPGPSRARHEQEVDRRLEEEARRIFAAEEPEELPWKEQQESLLD